MSKAAPTNSDIVKLITIQHEENSKRLTDIEAQVKYTNGQVRSLQQWRSNTEAASKAVDDYKQQNPQITALKVNNNFQWDWKVVLAIILTLASIAAAINGVAPK